MRPDRRSIAAQDRSENAQQYSSSSRGLLRVVRAKIAQSCHRQLFRDRPRLLTHHAPIHSCRISPPARPSFCAGSDGRQCEIQLIAAEDMPSTRHPVRMNTRANCTDLNCDFSGNRQYHRTDRRLHGFGRAEPKSLAESLLLRFASPRRPRPRRCEIGGRRRRARGRDGDRGYGANRYGDVEDEGIDGVRASAIVRVACRSLVARARGATNGQYFRIPVLACRGAL